MGGEIMCFKTSVSSSGSTTDYSAAPTTVNTGADETITSAQQASAKKQKNAAGYASTILSGTSGGTNSSSVSKKTLLGQ